MVGSEEIEPPIHRRVTACVHRGLMYKYLDMLRCWNIDGNKVGIKVKHG